jgi:hypothetical protein
MLMRRCLPGLLMFCFALPILAADWQPLNPADLALKQSKNDPNADAEALFREVHVSNEQHGASYPKNIRSEYVRLKIFTERGKEFGNVQIPYFREERIFNIAGRTIHPDGSVTELGKDSIFDKVIEKRGAKTKVITFAMPAVEPGSIIEYKFTEDEGERSFRYRALEVQSAFPVDEVTFFIKPLSASNSAYPTMRYMPFGCHPEPEEPTRDGFSVFKVKNVPAFHEETYSPPEYSAKQWILVYYEENSKTGKDKYWTALGKDRYKEYSEQLKINGEIKSLAAQITEGAATDEAKLDKILAYCRTQIKDVREDEITTVELDKAKPNRNTIDTIRRKEGDKVDIQMAFIALAQGAGYDARPADLSNRATFLFGPAMQSAFFLNSLDAVVNVGGKWKFYDVTNPALPGGQLRWEEQGVYALITDNKNPELVQTPMLTSKENSKNRVATFKISEDGVLEGDVREILFGNEASVWRERHRHTNQTQREDEIREDLKHRFADFDLSNIHVSASPDPAKPVGFTYHLVVRNYAQRTGKRLFVQPDFFASGYASRFPEATRYNDVYFEYPWSELDSVDLTIPAGFVLDHGDAPMGVNVPPNCTYSVKIGFDKAHNAIQYRRQFVFGTETLLLFDTKIYPALKKVFDTVHESDNHMLTFKAETPAAAPGQ